MKLYRVSMSTLKDGHEGYEWYSTKANAEKMSNQFKRERKRDCPGVRIEQFQIEPTVNGILAALAKFASHPSNG